MKWLIQFQTLHHHLLCDFSQESNFDISHDQRSIDHPDYVKILLYETTFPESDKNPRAHLWNEKWDFQFCVQTPSILTTTFEILHVDLDQYFYLNFELSVLRLNFNRNFDFWLWLFSLQLCSQLLPLLLGWAKVSSGEIMSILKISSLIFYRTQVPS